MESYILDHVLIDLLPMVFDFPFSNIQEHVGGSFNPALKNIESLNWIISRRIEAETHHHIFKP